VTTFADLGIDFPLFAADVSEATEWSPEGTCAVCGVERAGFLIGIGDYVAVTCESCGTRTYATADGRAEPCHHCAEPIRLEFAIEEEHGCWRCLRIGAWASTKDTEVGMVTPIHAAAGETHGRPYPQGAIAGTAWSENEDMGTTLAGWPVGPPNADGWRAARVPSGVLNELVRTPGYISWQGDEWLFHCEAAMRYLGLWGKAAFTRAAQNGSPEELAYQAAGIHNEAYADLANVGGESHVCVYMFDCTSCGTLRGHWDCD
jgi:hypothetical protein